MCVGMRACRFSSKPPPHQCGTQHDFACAAPVLFRVGVGAQTSLRTLARTGLIRVTSIFPLRWTKNMCMRLCLRYNAMTVRQTLDAAEATATRPQGPFSPSFRVPETSRARAQASAQPHLQLWSCSSFSRTETSSGVVPDMSLVPEDIPDMSLMPEDEDVSVHEEEATQLAEDLDPRHPHDLVNFWSMDAALVLNTLSGTTSTDLGAVNL